MTESASEGAEGARHALQGPGRAREATPGPLGACVGRPVLQGTGLGETETAEFSAACDKPHGRGVCGVGSGPLADNGGGLGSWWGRCTATVGPWLLLLAGWVILGAG